MCAEPRPASPSSLTLVRAPHALAQHAATSGRSTLAPPAPSIAVPIPAIATVGAQCLAGFLHPRKLLLELLQRLLVAEAGGVAQRIDLLLEALGVAVRKTLLTLGGDSGLACERLSAEAP